MKKLLVIEEERERNRAMEDLLKEEEVLQAYDWAITGNEAWGFLSDNSYAAVSFDIMVKKGDGPNIVEQVMRKQMGLFLLRKLRGGAFENHGTPRDVPVVVFSAITNEEDIKEIKGLLGANGFFFQKPFDPIQVLAKLKELMSV